MIGLKLFVITIVALAAMAISFIGWKVKQVLTMVMTLARAKTVKTTIALNKREPLPINYMKSGT